MEERFSEGMDRETDRTGTVSQRDGDIPRHGFGHVSRRGFGLEDAGHPGHRPSDQQSFGSATAPRKGGNLEELRLDRAEGFRPIQPPGRLKPPRQRTTFGSSGPPSEANHRSGEGHIPSRRGRHPTRWTTPIHSAVRGFPRKTASAGVREGCRATALAASPRANERYR